MQKPAKADPGPATRPDARAPTGTARVWDPLVRLFHWSLVASFATAWLSANRTEALHMWAGYAALGLIASRVVWGVVGTRHARFADFVRHPRIVIAYLRDIVRGTEARHIGHNPAGGAMVIALMAGVAALGLTGWMMYTDAWYGDDRLAALHGFIADGVLILILLHLAGVALASLRHSENLVRAMVTGAKRPPGRNDIG
ncbi:MAG: cytochrome b/b6 domain-containing protein [Proteobacteria bacterium]|nr:cytochrome b/b6 domain-containing protein [Pseudomonadota bacterium]MBS0574528.1 cytochrome b/b6 domain-containing protein [Pseudomonadota bacterium]